MSAESSVVSRARTWCSQGDRIMWPTKVDAAISAAVLLGIVGSQLRLDSIRNPVRDSGDHLVAVLALGAVAVGILLFRRRRPILVLALLPVVLGAASMLDAVNPAFTGVVGIAMFTVADQTNRRSTVVIGAAVSAVLYAGAIGYSDHGWDNGANLGILAWIGLAAAAGDANRNRRSYIAETEERVRKAEEERDVEAARQVTDERLRIARELHDVLAHHIAVIHVHAGLASATMVSDPATSRDSLGHVRQSAADVLGELGALMQILRTNDDQADQSAGPAAPAPGLDGLTDLIDNYRRSGNQIRVSVAGLPKKLPPAADLAAYRIVQEALTNAHKHGVPGSTELDLDYSEAELSLSVRNLTATRSLGGGTGHGLIGMRERAASVGADFRAESQDERYSVAAHFEFLTAGVEP